MRPDFNASSGEIGARARKPERFQFHVNVNSPSFEIQRRFIYLFYLFILFIGVVAGGELGAEGTCNCEQHFTLKLHHLQSCNSHKETRNMRPGVARSHKKKNGLDEKLFLCRDITD